MDVIWSSCNSTSTSSGVLSVTAFADCDLNYNLTVLDCSCDLTSVTLASCDNSFESTFTSGQCNNQQNMLVSINTCLACCTSHADCNDDEYCRVDGACMPGFLCDWNATSDPIDNLCPSTSTYSSIWTTACSDSSTSSTCFAGLAAAVMMVVTCCKMWVCIMPLKVFALVLDALFVPRCQSKDSQKYALGTLISFFLVMDLIMLVWLGKWGATGGMVISFLILSVPCCGVIALQMSNAQNPLNSVTVSPGQPHMLYPSQPVTAIPVQYVQQPMQPMMQQPTIPVQYAQQPMQPMMQQPIQPSFATDMQQPIQPSVEMQPVPMNQP